jgi:CubicO group peptidase (beta-lactamase class C family)
MVSIGRRMLFRAWLGMVGALLTVSNGYTAGAVAFPGANWEVRTPAELGLDAVKLNRIAGKLGSSGCIIKDGFVVEAWGNQSKQHDWYSSAKPIFSTLLFFAIHEGRISSKDEKIGNWDWPLKGKGREITFRHLANMTSGYMQPEGPGEAYAHNDFAVALFIRTLEKVETEKGTLSAVI